MTIQNRVRLEEMKHLRFEKKWSIGMIASKYSISTQRVCQLLGKTGTITWEHRREVKERELEMIPKRKMQAKVGAVKRGYDIEELVSGWMNSHGIEHEQMPFRHPYDVELADGRRVEIKSAWKPLKPITHNSSERWAFGQVQRKKADVFVFVIVPTKDCFVIPVDQLPIGTTKIMITWPADGKRSKYAKYHNRFDLLK